MTALGGNNDAIYGGNLGSPNNLGYVNKTVVGAPIGCFYGWKTAGIMTDADFNEDGSPKVPVFSSGSTYTPGDMKFVDVNGDGVIDDSDVHSSGILIRIFITDLISTWNIRDLICRCFSKVLPEMRFMM